jgi:PAS domain S-box-containing protein
VTNAINKADLYRYIQKPWDKDDFLLTIKGAFDSYLQQETIENQNKELKELNESLEQKVIERTQELMDANKKNIEYLEIIDKYVIISRIDTKGIVTYASGAFCQKSGFTKNDIIGKNYWETLYADLDEEDIQEILKTIHSGFSWTGEIKHKSKEGSYYWVYEIITPNI